MAQERGRTTAESIQAWDQGAWCLAAVALRGRLDLSPGQVGIGRIATALRPGGWLLIGHGTFSGGPVEDALTRFKTTAYGGTPLTGAQARDLLAGAGLDTIMALPTPPGAPALTVARRQP